MENFAELIGLTGYIIAMLIIMAVIVETCWQIVKMVSPRAIPDWLDVAGAICFGIAMAWQFWVDAPSIFLSQVSGTQYTASALGVVLTGIMISRGANVVHEAVEKMKRRE